MAIPNRKTKIICTIGPASKDLPMLRGLLQAGVDIFRFNLKYSTPANHGRIIDRARNAAAEMGKTIHMLIDIPGLSPHGGIDLAVKKQADYVALSYVTRADEITKLKQMLDARKLPARVVAKIETKEALHNFQEILHEANAIMVARGDLGNALPVEKVPFVQRELILASNKADTMVIVATEMLLSMVSKKEPTRAEVSDVANAVLEGSNAVMLSEETAIGKHPVEAARIMEKIITEAQRWQKLGHVEIFTEKNKKFLFGL